MPLAIKPVRNATKHVKNDHAWHVLDLFKAGSVSGVWYDPSDPLTRFQDVNGTTRADHGDPVGLILDKSRGLVRGAEKVSNGTFDTATGWTLGAGWAISGGVATATSAGSDMYCAVACDTGKTYEVTFTVSGYSAGSVTPYVFGQAGKAISANGTFTQMIVAGAGANLTMRGLSSFTGSIDDVSLRELPGHHATQSTTASRPTLRGEYWAYGAEKVTNGTFDTATDWTLDPNFSIGSGKLNKAVSTVSEYATQGIALVAGVTYEIAYDLTIDPATSGTPYVRLEFAGTGSTAAGPTVSTSGRHVTSVVAVTGNNTLRVVASSNVVGSLDNISVRERIHSVGTEKVTNGTFDTDTSGWSSVRSAVLSLSSNRLRVTNGGGVASGAGDQSITTVPGQWYVLTVDVTKGTVNADVRAGTVREGSDLARESSISASKNVRLIFKAATSTTYISMFNTAGVDGDWNEFDNVSVKPITRWHRWYLDHDGVDDFLVADSVAAFVSGTDKPVSVVGAYQILSGHGVYTWSNKANTTALIEQFASSTPLYQAHQIRDDAGVLRNAEITGSTPRALTVQAVIGSGTAVTTYQNGVSLGTSDRNVGPVTLDAFTIGATRRGNTAQYFAKGSIYGLVLVPGVLSDSDRQRLERFLANQSGVSL